MKTVGFPICRKENEARRAITPSDLKKVRNVKQLYFEQGYGESLGYTDDDYVSCGANIADFETILNCDIICDPKIGDEDYLGTLKTNKIVFGWVHAVQNRDITDKLINNELTAYAWEDMFEDGRHTFWHNNEMAGEAAIMHAFQCYGKMPYDTKVALIGRGNVSRGALRILTCLGAAVTIYDRRTEKLFRKEIEKYEVIVNALLWDTTREDHLVYEEDLKMLSKKGGLIIDISCDRSGAIETSIPTPIEDPTYTKGGVMHYVVDHTPSLFHKTATDGISAEVCKYIDQLIEDQPGKVLLNALIVKDGRVIDQRINEFQNRN